METRVLRIFQREVERQSRFGFIAATDLVRALQAKDTDRVWYSVQALLVAAGNVSKLLWPTRNGDAARGAELKASLGVNDTSPLAPRTLRNHYEHFDERLDHWAQSSKQRNFVDECIGPKDMISGIAPEDFLRTFDPATGVLFFRGDEYHLQPIIEALRVLWEKAKLESAKPPWE